MTMIHFLLQIPAILIAISFHEWAHAFAADRLGDHTARNLGRLSVNPLKHLDLIGTLCMLTFHYGWAKPVPIRSRNFKKPRRDMAIVAAAGPLTNFVIGFVAYFFCGTLLYVMSTMNVVDMTKMQYVGYMTLFFLRWILYYIALFNVALGLFNLIPIPPLDGSRLLYMVVPKKYQYKLYEFERYSFLLLVAILIVSSVYPFMDIALKFVLSGYAKAIEWLPFVIIP